MKNKFLVLTIIICFLIIPFSALAEEGGVYASSTSKTASEFETSKLYNGSASFKLANHNISIVSTNKSDNQDILMVPVKDQSLNWVKSSLNSYNVDKAYYVTFYSNGKKVMPQGNVTIYFSNMANKKLITIDLKGNIINSSGSYINVGSNDQYIVLVANNASDKNNKKTQDNIIFADCDENGMISLDGITYKGISQIKTTDSKAKVALIPNQGYALDSVFINNVNSNNLVNSGFISVNAGDSIKVTFKKENQTTRKSYNISGKITLDGKPIKQLKVILHSKESITYTDDNGYYHFDNISDGHHTLMIYNGTNLVGFKDFYIKSSKNTEIEQDTININDSVQNVVLDLNVDDYEVFFTKVNEENETSTTSDTVGSEIENNKNNQNNTNNTSKYLYIFIVIIILIIIIINIIKRRKNKNNNNAVQPENKQPVAIEPTAEPVIQPEPIAPIPEANKLVPDEPTVEPETNVTSEDNNNNLNLPQESTIEQPKTVENNSSLFDELFNQPIELSPISEPVNYSVPTDNNVTVNSNISNMNIPQDNLNNSLYIQPEPMVETTPTVETIPAPAPVVETATVAPEAIPTSESAAKAATAAPEYVVENVNNNDNPTANLPQESTIEQPKIVENNSSLFDELFNQPIELSPISEPVNYSVPTDNNVTVNSNIPDMNIPQDNVSNNSLNIQPEPITPVPNVTNASIETLELLEPTKTVSESKTGIEVLSL